jgi:hypothetical protein
VVSQLITEDWLRLHLMDHVWYWRSRLAKMLEAGYTAYQR